MLSRGSSVAIVLAGRQNNYTQNEVHWPWGSVGVRLEGSSESRKLRQWLCRTRVWT